MISAIIPAFNEERTIASVIAVLNKHPDIAEIIVIDDGSTDNTAHIAKNTNAKVISLSTNHGKAEAMEIGVTRATGDIIFFVDADITGLTIETIDILLEPVLLGTYDMFVAVRGRNMLILNRIIHLFPILGGERVLKRDLWNEVPNKYKTEFQIEIALNYFAKRNGRKMSFALIPDLHHTTKEKKYGLIQGIKSRFKLYRSVLTISFKLYIFRLLKSFFGKPEAAKQNPIPTIKS